AAARFWPIAAGRRAPASSTNVLHSRLGEVLPPPSQKQIGLFHEREVHHHGLAPARSETTGRDNGRITPEKRLRPRQPLPRPAGGLRRPRWDWTFANHPPALECAPARESVQAWRL